MYNNILLITIYNNMAAIERFAMYNVRKQRHRNCCNNDTPPYYTRHEKHVIFLKGVSLEPKT
jgi:hypothetical protein